MATVKAKKSKFSKRDVIIVVVLALVGAIVILRAKAASPSVSFEAESGTLAGNAAKISDTNASGGQVVQFGSTSPPPPSACTGPTVSVTGTTSSKYTNGSPTAGTTFNLTGWYSNAVKTGGPSAAFDVGTGNAPNGICVRGGVVNGHIDTSLSWDSVHTFGGFGFRTAVSGVANLDGIRVHNVEDGWKPRECATTSDQCSTFRNVGTMKLTNAYMTGIRDDSIEDDDFMPGDIQNSLFDGTYTFLSEQLQGSSGTGVGTSEDPYIHLTNVYARLYPTNPPTGGSGPWFKWKGSGAHHKLIIKDSVFATDKAPNSNPGSGWSELAIPAGTTWQGTNYILWLGTVGGYQGPCKTAGSCGSNVAFLEGQAAKDKWNQFRNDWLAAHGYATKAADDLNPMDDPVVAPQ